MNYEDFLPFVAPFAASCPRETLLHNIRQAAIEFCARTHVWREDMDTLLADGYSTSYELPIDDQTAVAKLLTVTVKDGADAKAVDACVTEPVAGRAAMRDGSSDTVVWTDNRATLGIYPPPNLDAEIDVYVALKPSQASYSFPDDLFEHHAEAIASGALYRVLSLPGTWADVDAALRHRSLYDGAIATVGHQAERGFARKAPQKQARFY